MWLEVRTVVTSGKEGRGRDWGAGVKGREFLSHRCAHFVMIHAFAFHACFCVYVINSGSAVPWLCGLGKLPNLSVPQSAYLKNGGNSRTDLVGLLRMH